MTAKEFYIQQKNLGRCDNITSNPNPDYNLDFYKEIFDLMNGFKQSGINSEDMSSSENVTMQQLNNGAIKQ